MAIRRQLIISLLLLLIVAMVAVVGYRWLGGPEVTLLDAIYMAVITFATVGYGEVVDTSAHPTLRLFNIFVILFGIGIMLYVFSASTAFIVGGELKDIFRRRKMLKQIHDMSDHFIVCGAGETGHYVVEELLKTGNNFVVVDQDRERLEKIQLLGSFPVLEGDASDDETLETAGIARARGLASVLPDDRDNLMVTVTARQKNPRLRIVARCTDERMAERVTMAGANSAVSPSMIGGLRLASELIRPQVVGFLDLMLREKSRTVRVEEISVGDSSPWIGKTLKETDLRGRFQLLALAVRKSSGELSFSPSDDWRIAPGDVLVVLGDMKGVWRAREAAGEKVPQRAG
ncbi:MAG TPA: potassium channel protein [Terriglobia bacterium]|jgi:voltage-gated potassium channel|nr:potassium channel protein [Terriglobia bacterium]